MFCTEVDLDLLKQLQCLVDKTLCCLGNIYLGVLAQSSSRKKMFWNISQILENACAGFSFLIKLQGGSIQLY